MEGEEFNPDTSSIEHLFTGLTVESNIGHGGQKIVYVGSHAKYGRVALKLIRPGGDEEKQRIRREIRTSLDLSGPRFPRLFEWGEKAINGFEVLYIVEEYLNGMDLRQVLRAVKRMELTAALHLGEELLMALVDIHQRRIVHRDIKPENIFITSDDRVVLLDFGIARHLELSGITRESAPFGPLTPGYAAPEQIRNQQRRITCRTDLFQFGIVLYECLAGVNPFTEGVQNPMEAMRNNLEMEPRPLHMLGFSRRLSFFVETCLQKHAARRYASPQDALSVLRRLPREGGA